MGRKGPGPRPRARTKKTREGKSWLEQQQARSWGVGPATSQAPSRFRVGRGSLGTWCSRLGWLLDGVPDCTGCPPVHDTPTVAQRRTHCSRAAQVVTRRWLGVPWLGCSLTERETSLLGQVKCRRVPPASPACQHVRVPKRHRDRGFPDR